MSRRINKGANVMRKKQRSDASGDGAYLVRWIPWGERIPGGWRIAACSSEVKASKHFTYSRLVMKVAR